MSAGDYGLVLDLLSLDIALQRRPRSVDQANRILLSLRGMSPLPFGVCNDNIQFSNRSLCRNHVGVGIDHVVTRTRFVRAILWLWWHWWLRLRRSRRQHQLQLWPFLLQHRCKSKPEQRDLSSAEFNSATVQRVPFVLCSCPYVAQHIALGLSTKSIRPTWKSR